MGQKVKLEVTQSVVSGNEVVVHSGELYDVGEKLPDAVSVRPVMVDVPDKPAVPDKPPAQEKPATQDKPPAKASGR